MKPLMSRRIVILFCCVNALLGIGVLWYVLAPRLASDENRWEAPSKHSAPEYSDEELWQKAAGASTVREARSYLAKLGATRENLDKSARLLEELVQAPSPAFARWPYFEALLWFHGSRAESLTDLDALMRLAVQPGQALTLRDAAFCSYIENFSRLSPTDAGATYGLIDALYGEGNSLSATALQAERFLLEKGIGRAQAADKAGDRFDRFGKLTTGKLKVSSGANPATVAGAGGAARSGGD